MTLFVLNNILITNNSQNKLQIQQFTSELRVLQKRIYKATICHNYKQVHKLQKLLLTSKSIKSVVLLSILNTCFDSWDNALETFSYYLQNIYSQADDLTIKQLQSFFVDHIVINKLHFAIEYYLIYLCLKPEWEAKFTSSSSLCNLNHSYIYKLDVISKLYLLYIQDLTVKCKKIYILKNKIDILHNLNELDCIYLQKKLHSISIVNRFIKKYLTSYTSKCYQKDKIKILSFSSFHILNLIKKIIFEDLSNEIGLYKHLFKDTKNNNTGKLTKLLWHDGYFILFCSSKNEIILFRQRIAQFLTNIGLKFNTEYAFISEIKNGFNFLDFYITCKSGYNSETSFNCLQIQPSIKSQLRLLKAIKKILYHKNGMHYIRRNNYLSYPRAISKVRYLVDQWKNYYCASRLISKHSYVKLNHTIQRILSKWYTKNRVKTLNTHIVSGLHKKLKINNLL